MKYELFGYRAIGMKKAFGFFAATVFLFSAVVFISPIKSQAVYIPPSTITTSDIIASDGNLMISYPHYGTPVFVEPGQQFVAEVRAGSSYGTSGWTAWVENEYQKWDCTVGTVTYGSTNVYLSTKAGYKVPVTLPSGVTPELCTLVLQHGTDLTLRSPMSVNIVPELDTSFYFADVTDTHLGWNNDDDPDGDGSPEAYGLMTKALNVTGVRFLSHTGDMSLYPLKSRADDVRDAIIGEQLSHSGSVLPFVATAGNHEYDTWVYPIPSITTGSYYDANGNGVQDPGEFDGMGHFDGAGFDRYFGMRSAIMPMGTFTLAKHDINSYWGDTALRNAMATKWNAVSGTAYRLLFEHTHVGDGTPLFETPLGTPAPTPYPNLEVKGHDHQWVTNQTSPYRVISAGGGSWTAGSCALISYNYSGGAWTTPQSSSWSSANMTAFIDRYTRAYKIWDSYTGSNNGTLTSNSCTVTNQINFNFYDGRVRFVMDAGNYDVTGGTKLSQYNSADGSKTIVLAKVNIPANGTATVSVSPTQTTTWLMSDSFNTYTTGSAPSNWTITSSGGPVTTQEVPTATEKSMKLYKADGNTGYSAAERKFTAQTSGIVHYDTWVMTPETSSIKFLMMRNNAGTQIPFKVSFDNGNIKINDSTTIQAFTAGSWYHVVADLNVTSKTLVLYVNDVNKGTYNFYQTSSSDIGSAMFSISPNFLGTLYVNYVAVTK